MDELESRLRDGLGRHASGLPHYTTDLSRVRTRGRNRRWATRGAAFGTVALLGAGAVALAVNSGQGGVSVSAGDSGIEVAGPGSDPTPTPTATPPDESDDPVEDESQPPDDIGLDVDGASLLVATGWGVGIVTPAGDLHAPLVCCEDDGLRWEAQPTEAPALGALRVRDDLAGGIVTSTSDALWWLPESALGSGAPPILLTTIGTTLDPADPADPDAADNADPQEATAAAALSSVSSLELWDVIEVDDEIRVLYSADRVADDGSTGVAGLFWLTPGPDPEPVELERVEWTAEDGSAQVWHGASWLPEGGHLGLQSTPDGSCDWLTFADPDQLYVNPYPEPVDHADCPHDSLGAAMANHDGLVAVTERYLSSSPRLAVFDRAGNRISVTDLPDRSEDQGFWTEIDMLGDQVLVSRDQRTTPGRAVELDQTLRVDGSIGRAVTVRFWGTPSWARSELDTTGLAGLEPSDALWFEKPRTAAEAEGDGSDGEGTDGNADITVPDESAAPTPAPDEPARTPQPDATEPGPEPLIDDEDRQPTGRGVRTLGTGATAGDNGCLGTICLGMPIEEALDAATAEYGPEDSDTPEALREGEPPPADEHIFITEATWLEIREQDARVREVRTFPLGDGASDDPRTVGDILALLGAPAEVFLGGGEGSDVLWLFYETDAGLIGYGVVESWGVDDRRLTEAISGGIPSAYDDLRLNAYWAS